MDLRANICIQIDIYVYLCLLVIHLFVVTLLFLVLQILFDFKKFIYHQYAMCSCVLPLFEHCLVVTKMACKSIQQILTIANYVQIMSGIRKVMLGK